MCTISPEASITSKSIIWKCWGKLTQATCREFHLQGPREFVNHILLLSVSCANLVNLSFGQTEIPYFSCYIYFCQTDKSDKLKSEFAKIEFIHFVAMVELLRKVHVRNVLQIKLSQLRRARFLFGKKIPGALTNVDRDPKLLPVPWVPVLITPTKDTSNTDPNLWKKLQWSISPV